eukprot:Gregarina_sp_Poly_1__7788@NODE_4403_length_609_cov_101_483395_g412_i2_p1_GENE_NODE_4403_length_609_cov_101_483395_g412_i2NODE_4403_length_609_cov_101_483395_g412_i2_p1_ORF_typecomplete_len164_score39_49MAD/PF05557_13/0_086Foamy_virus_ENV/PF03408_14/91Foamy_virus_ENV/PF03408_14/0_064HOOK/PF05622_12/0_15Csm1_N/PF18504_1/19Csm1_N/PF18504_1/1_1e02Csm1_N/PF18504_1/0_46Golgin_A5/PF09787_9/8_6Golgin_A5/PF09787_9/0_95YabA/PF06156_13/0_67YabA/PF06156_13/42SOGA/PF11365_8/0_58SOGA/PF11365_8/1_1e03SOGA/PF11
MAKVSEAEAETSILKDQISQSAQENESLRLEIHRLSLIEADHRNCGLREEEKKDVAAKLNIATAKIIDRDAEIETLKTKLIEYEAMKTKYEVVEAEALESRVLKERLEEKTQQLNAYKERSRTLQHKLQETEEVRSYPTKNDSCRLWEILKPNSMKRGKKSRN